MADLAALEEATACQSFRSDHRIRTLCTMTDAISSAADENATKRVVDDVPPIPSPTTKSATSRVVCVGDLHGNIVETRSLWTFLTKELGEDALLRSSVIFLGDYCDRGPDTKKTLDWLIALEQDRAKKGGGGTHFIAGNHDFAMGAYLGYLPCGKLPKDFDLEKTRNPSWTTGFFQPAVEGGMHYQGRRWGGSPIYNADTTFRSYGVSIAYTTEARKALIAAVPKAHKEFIKRLKWIHEEDVTFAPKRIVCVHAGLVSTVPFEKQAPALRARDVTAFGVVTEKDDVGRFPVFSGRQKVEYMHPDLNGKAMLISGHHGFYKIDKDRIIVDMSGGRPHKSRPIEAVVLPDRIVIGSGGARRDMRDTTSNGKIPVGRMWSLDQVLETSTTAKKRTGGEKADASGGSPSARCLLQGPLRRRRRKRPRRASSEQGAPM